MAKKDTKKRVKKKPTGFNLREVLGEEKAQEILKAINKK